jgi:hypothetical protein
VKTCHVEVLHHEQWIADLGLLLREEVADVTPTIRRTITGTSVSAAASVDM